MAEIRFNNERLQAVLGDSLLEHAERTEVAYKQVASSCDGMGTCGECIVSVVAGAESLAALTAVAVEPVTGLWFAGAVEP